jgi:TPR repeat protein
MAGGRNAVEAVYWYRQALRLCAADAMLYIGDAYFNGDGAPKETRTGFQLMRLSSGLGSRRATELVREKLKRQEIPLAPPEFSDLYRGSR